MRHRGICLLLEVAAWVFILLVIAASVIALMRFGLWAGIGCYAAGITLAFLALFASSHLLTPGQRAAYWHYDDQEDDPA